MAELLLLMGAPCVVAPVGVSAGWALPLFGQGQDLDVTGLAFRVIVALGVTAGLLLIITHLLQRFGFGTAPVKPKANRNGQGKNQRAERGKPAVVIEHIMPLTRQAKVATIDVDGHRMIVGVTDQQVTLLKDLGDTEDVVQEPVTGELERYPIDPAIIRAAQLRQQHAD